MRFMIVRGYCYLWVHLLLFFILGTLDVCTQAVAQGLNDRKALLIGNYAYKKKGYRLRTPRQDIKEIKRTLKKSGFQVTTHYNLTADQLDKVIVDFGHSLTANSVGYIHYAGHGIE